MDRADVLIIMDGGLAGTIACAMECERGLSVVAWQAPPSSALFAGEQTPLDDVRAASLVRAQAELFGAAEIVPAVASPDDPADAAALLLHAARDATARGAGRVVWPRACGESVDEMFRVTERADLVARLAALDADDRSGTALRIETPFVDLTHEQLLDLARDLEIADSIWAGRSAATYRRPVGPAGGSAAVA